MRPLIFLRDLPLFTLPQGLQYLVKIYNPQVGGQGEFHLVMAASVIITAADDPRVLPRPAVLHRRDRDHRLQGLMPRLMSGAVASAADDLVLGLDVGGTKLAAGVVAGSGRVLSMEVAPSRVEEGPDVDDRAPPRPRPRPRSPPRACHGRRCVRSASPAAVRSIRTPGSSSRHLACPAGTTYRSLRRLRQHCSARRRSTTTPRRARSPSGGSGRAASAASVTSSTSRSRPGSAAG